MLRRVSTSRV
ncbi:hypothetical protein YPPY76_0421, partial [Yersinia pestis PY-76]